MGRLPKEAQEKASANKIANGYKLDKERGYFRECRACGKKAYTHEDLEEFVRSSTSRHGYSNECKQCKRERADSVARRENHYNRLYGIGIEDYNCMFDEQKGKCAICGKASEQHFHVDHCHDTGEVRGLLCSKCNTGLGLFKDDVSNLSNAIKYLEKG